MPKVRTSALAAAVVRDITKEGFFHPAASRGFIYLGLRFFMGKTKLIVVTDRHVISSKLLLKGIRSEISAVVILKTVSIAIENVGQVTLPCGIWMQHVNHWRVTA